MKTLNYFLAILFAFVLFSCEDDEPNPEPNPNPEPVVIGNSAYIINYGSYNGAKSEISVYDLDSNTISHDAYKGANGVEFSSNIQSVAVVDTIAYFMSNDGDKIDMVSAKSLKAIGNPVSEGITKPRYMVAKDGFAYISCWGEVISWAAMENSYIAKMNLSTKEITPIKIPGGPEGVIIVGNKLYAGLTAKKKIAVIDLSSNEVSYINTPAIPQHFIVDGDKNLWVSLVSTYTVPCSADSLGLAQIDTDNATIKSKVNIPGMGSAGNIQVSPSYKTIYALCKEAWPGTKSSIMTFDIATSKVSASAFIEGEHFNGFNVNPSSGDIFVCISPGATTTGSIQIYDEAGKLKDNKEVGTAPLSTVFYSFEK
ncbi:MAG: hypothetical protein MI922_18350 [Bacteroidales bacterium]|nr:hypothetical protein [Bacteroidales bacterium]